MPFRWLWSRDGLRSAGGMRYWGTCACILRSLNKPSLEISSALSGTARPPFVVAGIGEAVVGPVQQFHGHATVHPAQTREFVRRFYDALITPVIQIRSTLAAREKRNVSPDRLSGD
jgi:hypothetical protein